MNKKLLCLFTFVIALGLAFTACSDDDDDTTVDYARDVAATYGGTLSIPGLGAAGAPLTIEKDITLTRTALNRAKLELRDFSLPIGTGLPIGTIAVDNIEITKSGDVYTLKETTTTLQVPAIGQDGTIEANVKVSGTVNGNTMNIKIDVSNVPVLNTLAITFAGTKK